VRHIQKHQSIAMACWSPSRKTIAWKSSKENLANLDHHLSSHQFEFWLATDSNIKKLQYVYYMKSLDPWISTNILITKMAIVLVMGFDQLRILANQTHTQSKAHVICRKFAENSITWRKGRISVWREIKGTNPTFSILFSYCFIILTFPKKMETKVEGNKMIGW